MGWLGRNRGYDRSRVLKQATHAVRRGRHGKALTLYQQVLEHEPNNTDLHRRVAPLLARAGKREEAWASYRRAGEALVRQGFVEQAIGVYREACDRLPRAVEAWLALADLEAERGRPRDAVQTLLAGRRRFRSRRDRKHAVRLLKRARRIDPSDFASTFDLAGLAAQVGLRAHAQRMLEEIAPTCTRRQLRRLRARQFAIAPGARTLWMYLRALLGIGAARSVRRLAA
jgi:tetratricopeptide (TPR) repeat protein